MSKDNTAPMNCELAFAVSFVALCPWPTLQTIFPDIPSSQALQDWICYATSAALVT